MLSSKLDFRKFRKLSATLYLGAQMNFYSYRPIWVKFNVNSLHIMRLGIYVFCESRFGEGHILFKCVKQFYLLFFLHSACNLDKIRYRWCGDIYWNLYGEIHTLLTGLN